MKIPIHKKILSYFSPIIYEQLGSSYNPVLNVLLEKGQFQLCTEDAIYSFGHRYLNFTNTFKKLDFEKLQVKKVLLLGLGLGSIPHILEKKFNKKFDYVGVEIDEVIVQLAQKYTLDHLESYVEVYHCDAMDFMQMNNESFDLIAMDIFQSANIPEKFQSKDFLNLLKEKLNPDGILLYNRMAMSNKDEDENKVFNKSFKSIFNSGDFIRIKYNHMYISNINLLK